VKPVLRKVKISGTGSYVPPRVVTNEWLAEQIDTTDEWISQRTGIKERRWVDAGTGPSDLALNASNAALEAAGCKAEDLDMIVLASLSPEHYFPGTSAFLQHKLGLETTPAMDIRCQCTGFIYALSVAKLMVAAGQYDKVLLVGTEVHSTGLDISDRGRDTAVIFGDGAGALVLEPADDDADQDIFPVRLHAQGEHAKRLWNEVPTTLERPVMSHAQLDEGRQYPKMDGRFVFKHAVTRMPQVMNEVLDDSGFKMDDVNFFLFHQANLRINEFVGQHLKIPEEKVANNIERLGNCSAASIPILLDECIRDGKIKRGDLVCMSGFGSGFTWGAAVLRY
jgi:3-oxoacyl-[acyl-carrier-protein] synthase-3